MERGRRFEVPIKLQVVENRKKALLQIRREANNGGLMVLVLRNGTTSYSKLQFAVYKASHLEELTKN